MRYRLSLALCGLLSTGLSTGVRAADMSSVISDVIGGTNDHLKQVVDENHRELIRDVVISDVNTELVQFLKGANVQLKMLDVPDSPAGDQVLGMTYDLKKNIAHQEPNAVRQYKLDFNTAGTASFDDAVRPTDFLETRLDFNVRWFDNGVLDATGEQRLAARVLQQVSLQAAQQGLDANSPAFRRLVASRPEIQALNRGNLIYSGLDVHATLESDQAFEQKQYVYGIGGFFLCAIQDRQSAAAQFNIFDYPFKIARMLTGYPEPFETARHSFPRLRFAIEQVDPKTSDARQALTGNLATFERFQAEIALSSPIALIGNAPVKASLAYRYFREINPPAVVEGAGLDTFNYLTAAIHFPNGIAFTYSRGALPFDLKSESVYALGYQWSL